MRDTTIPPIMLTEREASLYLNIPVKTLQSWRVDGRGPAFVKMRRLVRYELTSLQTFIANNRQFNTCKRGQ